MKELLLEFLSTILSEKKVTNATGITLDIPDTKPPEAKFSSGGKWFSDEGHTDYVGRMYKGKWVQATAAEKEQEKTATDLVNKGVLSRDTGPERFMGRGAQKQPNNSTVPKSPEEAADAVVANSGDEEEVNAKGVYDEKDTLQRDVVGARTPQEVFDTLDTLAKEEKELAIDGEWVIVKGKKVKKPKAGAGGLVPSTGETLCTEAQTAMINGQYDNEAVRNSPEFIDAYERLGNKHQKPTREIELIADIHGIPLYDENEEFDPAQLQECLQVMAEAEVWIDQQDTILSETPAGKAFGKGAKGEEARRAWLQAAFHSGYSILANGPLGRDKNQPSRVLKANSRTDGAVQELLKQKRTEAKTKEERDHYDRQLKVWEKFQPYHDTYMVYTDTNGRTNVFHISNKKGADLADPHNNTSPKRRLLNYLLAATKIVPKPNDPNDPAQVEASKAEAKRIAAGIGAADKTAREGIEDIDATVWSALGELNASTDDSVLMGDLFLKLPQGQRETDVGDKYFLELTAPGSASGRLLIRAGVDVTNPQAVITHILNEIANTDDTSKLPKAWADRVGLKFGTLAQRVFEKIDDQELTAEQTAAKLGLTTEQVEAIHASEVMKKLASAKKIHAAGLEGVNAQFVESLHKIDGREPGYTGDNGDAVATYIRGTLQALHIDTYVTNYDEDALIESGGMGTKSVDVRNCMAKLSGFTGDVSNSGDREKLNDHLATKLKIEPGSDAVYIFAADGKTKIYIAQETWRQSGKSKKVASGFGKDLRTCLTKEGSRRRQSST